MQIYVKSTVEFPQNPVAYYYYYYYDPKPDPWSRQHFPATYGNLLEKPT